MPKLDVAQTPTWQSLCQRTHLGSLVVLEPLSWAHTKELLEIVTDERIWRFLTSCASSQDSLERYVAEALQARDAQTAIPFVVRWRDSGNLVGSTRLNSYSRAHRRVTVGSWFAPAVWGKGANTESKLLLLSLAFDQLACLRVEFNTDSRNRRSRVALKAIAAMEEGTLRSWGETRGGPRRDNVIFSILDEEWPESRLRLLSRLDRVRNIDSDRRT